MQQELRRFPHRTDEQQHCDCIGGIYLKTEEGKALLCQFRTHRQNHIKLDRVRHPIQTEDPQQEAEIANAVDDKGLHRRRTCAWLAEIEANQKIGGDPYPFPPEEELQQVIRGHQHQHGKGEERQIGKEPRAIAFAFAEIVVMRHVAKGIQMHERRDRGDHNQHNRRQAINANGPIREQAA